MANVLVKEINYIIKILWSKCLLFWSSGYQILRPIHSSKNDPCALHTVWMHY